MAERSILIPLDGSDLSRTVLGTVRALFDAASTRLTLLRVGDAPSPPVRAPNVTRVLVDGEARLGNPFEGAEVEDETHVWTSQEWESARARLRDELSTDAHRLAEEGWQVEVETAFGEPAREIVRWCEAHQPDLVAMATHGRTGLARVVLGSVAQRALRRLAVPVLMVRPGDLEAENETIDETVSVTS